MCGSSRRLTREVKKTSVYRLNSNSFRSCPIDAHTVRRGQHFIAFISTHAPVSNYLSARTARLSELICSILTHRDHTIVMQTPGRSDWILAICSVVFDLDVGQQMESVYPIAAISETTATSVAFHAFPVSTRDDRQLAVKQNIQLLAVCK